MKHGVICAVMAAAVLCASPPHATACSAGSETEVSVFPPPDVFLPLNGRIILEAVPGILGTEILTELADHHPALRAGEESVPLHVVEKQGLDRDVSKVVLAPDRQLRTSTPYGLTFNPPFEGSDREVLRPIGRINWKTGSTVDRSAPRWLSPPKVGTAVSEGVKCFPRSYVDISTALSEVAWIRVELRQHGDRRRWRVLYFPADGRVRVNLSPEATYTLTLTAVDLAGNESKAPGRPIEITMPSRQVTARR